MGLTVQLRSLALAWLPLTRLRTGVILLFGQLPLDFKWVNEKENLAFGLALVKFALTYLSIIRHQDRSQAVLELDMASSALGACVKR